MDFISLDPANHMGKEEGLFIKKKKWYYAYNMNVFFYNILFTKENCWLNLLFKLLVSLSIIAYWLSLYFECGFI